MTENSYAATATAEKRLREVLAARFGAYAEIDDLAKVLLEDAEIEYLPRKKSVSIRLVVPEFASSKPKSDIADPVAGKDYSSGMNESEAIAALSAGSKRAQAVEDRAVANLGTTDLPHDRGVTVGRFEPVSDASEEDDYFTE